MHREQRNGSAFSLSVADLMHDEREALKLAFATELLDRVITYPVVFVRGARVSGGFLELEERVNDGRFAATLVDERTEWTPPDQLELPLETKPRLLSPAGGGRWATFQWYVYGNVLRLYAVMQVATLALALALLHAEHERVAAAVLGVLGVDMALFVVLGAAPWSKWPPWRGHSWPPRAPRAASEGFGLLSALGRSGAVSQIPQGGRGIRATPHQSHRSRRV